MLSVVLIIEIQMFRKNTEHLTPDLFGIQNTLPESMLEKVHKSEEYHFYKIIFSHIKEDIFKVLYSEKKSRPNAPINAMVSALILMNRNKWTYEELFKNICFNILVKIALGLDNLTKMPFCPATLFNFQNKLSAHFVKTGENLLEQVFDSLTVEQLKTLKIKTNIQRTDSFLAASNIRNFSRVQLLVEIIIRLYRILSKEDKERFKVQFQPYVRKTSGQYIYKLKASDLPHQLEKIGEMYFWIFQNLKAAYGEYEIFRTFERVYAEHFTIIDKKVEVKSSKELHSGCVQSPDDLDATYREKREKKSKGQAINVTETASPDNRLNLITDVDVNPNNIDDSKVLNKRIDKLKEKTPDLNELHFDGAYGSIDNDRKFDKHNINPIQTGVRGKDAAVNIKIDQISESQYLVSCPKQKVKSEKARKRLKAKFDLSICNRCKHREKCQTLQRKGHRVFYFTSDDYLKKKREGAINTIPPERRKLRSNIEATVNEFVSKMPKGKLKVRGAFKASIFAYSVAISVNFGRIYRLLRDNPEYVASILQYFYHFVKEQLRLIAKKIINTKNLSFEPLKLKYISVLCF